MSIALRRRNMRARTLERLHKKYYGRQVACKKTKQVYIIAGVQIPIHANKHDIEPFFIAKGVDDLEHTTLDLSEVVFLDENVGNLKDVFNI